MRFNEIDRLAYLFIFAQRMVGICGHHDLGMPSRTPLRTWINHSDFFPFAQIRNCTRAEDIILSCLSISHQQLKIMGKYL
jgi:hypothetical protein